MGKSLEVQETLLKYSITRYKIESILPIDFNDSIIRVTPMLFSEIVNDLS